jgi:hypothetical protein
MGYGGLGAGGYWIRFLFCSQSMSRRRAAAPVAPLATAPHGAEPVSWWFGVPSPVSLGADDRTCQPSCINISSRTLALAASVRMSGLSNGDCGGSHDGKSHASDRHFVGSIPLPDAETVFRTLSAVTRPHLLRLPDGCAPLQHPRRGYERSRGVWWRGKLTST